MNLLQSRTPEVATLILQQISLNYHEAVMAPAGNDAEKSFSETLAGGDFSGWPRALSRPRSRAR